MLKRMQWQILATVICTIVLVSFAAAHDVRISRPAKVGNGPELQAGTYRVEVVKKPESPEVRFYQEGDVVATAPATWTKEAVKCISTEVHAEEVAGRRVITKIWLEGSKESLVFKTDILKTQ